MAISIRYLVKKYKYYKDY